MVLPIAAAFQFSSPNQSSATQQEPVLEGIPNSMTEFHFSIFFSKL